MAEKIKLGSNGNFGVKEGGTLAYNDENGVFKAIELASSRASGATYVAESGLIADAEVGVPRIDWTNGVGELLLEPQRRNLLPYSEDFTVSDWTSLSTATLSASTTLAPDGSLNAVKVTATGSAQDLREVVSIASGSVYTNSCYIRRVTGTGDVHLIGVAGAESSPLSLTSDWQRFEIQQTSIDTNGRFYVRIDTSGDEIEVWGAQLEDNGSLGGGVGATSYIPTSGSSVTRIADAVTGATGLGSVISSSEGVLYAEVSYFDKDTESNSITLSDGTTNNRITFRRMTTGQLGAIVLSSGTPVFSDSSISPLNAEETYKIAFKYKSGDYAVWLNGVELLTNTSTTLPLNLSKLELGQGAGILDNLYGRLKELKVYNTALTDAQLTTLTS